MSANVHRERADVAGKIVASQKSMSYVYCGKTIGKMNGTLGFVQMQTNGDLRLGWDTTLRFVSGTPLAYRVSTKLEWDNQ